MLAISNSHPQKHLQHSAQKNHSSHLSTVRMDVLVFYILQASTLKVSSSICYHTALRRVWPNASYDAVVLVPSFRQQCQRNIPLCPESCAGSTLSNLAVPCHLALSLLVNLPPRIELNLVQQIE